MHNNDLGRSVTWLFNSAEIQWSVNLAVEYITALTLQTELHQRIFTAQITLSTNQGGKGGPQSRITSLFSFKPRITYVF